MQKLILSFNLPAKKAAKLRVIAMRLGAAVRTAEKRTHSMPLNSILGGEPIPAGLSPAGAFDGEMLVIAGFSQAELELFLQQLRVQKIPVALKAVLTETNADWSAAALYAQLCAERDALAAGRHIHESE